ncbi:zinc ribbon domain-containing protein, partial [Methanosarcinales archaeon]
MNRKQLFGLIGSIVLFVGVFAPVVSVPIVGNMNYFQNGKGDGTIILIFAAISFVLALIKKYKGLRFTGLGSIGIMLFTFINFHYRMSQVKAK